YRVDGVGTGEVAVSVTEGGHGAALAEASASVQSGKATPLDFTIAVGSLVAKVRRADGSPAASLTLSASNTDTGGVQLGVESAPGTHEWRRLRPGSYLVTARSGANPPYPAPDDDDAKYEHNLVHVTVGQAATLQLTIPEADGVLEG